ncbi:MAG: hypothetical protein ACOCX4_02195 [Planctomycetota bacterium]
MLIAFLCCTVAVRGGETVQPGRTRMRSSDPLALSPDLVAIVRIEDLRQWGEKMDAFLRDIAPADWTLPGATLRVVGEYLRNPGLENVSERAFLEGLVFMPRRGELASPVLAFPVDEPQTYVRLLSSQATISSQAGPDGIIHFREELEQARDFHLCTVRDRIVIFGADRSSVNAARTLYEDAEGSLLSRSPADMEIRFHLKRYLNANAAGIDRALARLREDLTEDLSRDETHLREPLGRLFGSVLGEARGLSAQFGRLRLLLLVDRALPITGERRDALEAHVDLTFEAGTAGAFLAQAAPRPPRLLTLVPEEVASVDWTALNPPTVRAYLTGLGRTAAAALRGPLGARARAAVEETLERLLDLQPTESVSATLPGSGGGINRLCAIRVTRGADAPPVLTHALRQLRRDGPLAEDLARNNLALSVEPVDRAPMALRSDGGFVRAYELVFRITASDDLDIARAAPLEFRRRLHLAVGEGLFLIASGPDAATLCTETLNHAADGNAPFLRGEAGRNAARMLGGATRSLDGADPVLHLSLLEPTPYLRGVVAAARAPAAGADRAGADNATAFRNVRGSGQPLLVLFAPRPAGLGGPDLRVTVRLPYEALRRLVYATLVTPMEGSAP